MIRMQLTKSFHADVPEEMVESIPPERVKYLESILGEWVIPVNDLRFVELAWLYTHRKVAGIAIDHRVAHIFLDD